MRVAIYTLGCKVNQYETQAMEQELLRRGHTLVPFEEEADAYIINTCSVTAVSDKKSRQMIRRAKKRNPARRGGRLRLLCADPRRDEAAGAGHRPDRAAPATGMAFLDAIRAGGGGEPQPLTCWWTTPCAAASFEVLPAGGMAEPHPRHAEGGGRLRATSAPTASSPTPGGRVRSLPLDAAVAADGAAGGGGLPGDGAHRHRDLLLGSRSARTGPALIDLMEAVSAGRAAICACGWAVWSRRTITEDFCRRAAAAAQPVPPLPPVACSPAATRRCSGMNRKYDTARYLRVRHAAARDTFDRPAVTTDLICGFPGETEEEFAADAGLYRTVRLRRHAHLPLLHPPRHQGRRHGAAQRQPVKEAPRRPRRGGGVGRCTGRIWRAAWGRCIRCCSSRSKDGYVRRSCPQLYARWACGCRRIYHNTVRHCEDHRNVYGDILIGRGDITWNHFFAYINPDALHPPLGADAQQLYRRTSRSTAIRWRCWPTRWRCIRNAILRRAGGRRVRWRWRRCTTTPARSSPATCPPPSNTITPPSGMRTRQVEHVAEDKLLGMLPAGAAPGPTRTRCTRHRPGGGGAGEGGGQAVRPHQVHRGTEGRQQRVPSGRRPDRRRRMDAMRLPELDYFREHFLPSYSLTLDELE